MKHKRSLGPALLRILAGLLALVLLAAALFFGVPLLERGDRSAVPGSADWMAELDDALPLNRITLPGTHDSATQYCQLAFFSKCQGTSISQQLEAGARYLDIRLGVDEHNGIFKLMHGFTSCKPSAFSLDVLYLDDMLRECYAFLAAHPTETVLFAVKQEHGEESVETFETMLDAYLREHPDYWLLTDTVPTLGEARGKLVLLRRYPDAALLGARAGIPLVWDSQSGYADTRLNVAAEEQGAYTLWVQDRYEYAIEDKWAAFLLGMAESRERRVEGDIALHFLSTKGRAAYGHPYAFARELNRRLAEQLSFDGWVVLDFLSAPLAERIYAVNFR